MGQAGLLLLRQSLFCEDGAKSSCLGASASYTSPRTQWMLFPPLSPGGEDPSQQICPPPSHSQWGHVCGAMFAGCCWHKMMLATFTV